jgi:hypothetical protein
MSLKTIPTPRNPIVLQPLHVIAVDAELLWLFERAELEVSTPSSWVTYADAALDGRRRRVAPDDLDAAERRADAYHRARTIVDWLERVPQPQRETLTLAYRPAMRPKRFDLRFGKLAGIVANLASVNAQYQAARRSGETRTIDPIHWLTERIERGDEEPVLCAWAEAVAMYVVAHATYLAVRGTRPSLVEEDP